MVTGKKRIVSFLLSFIFGMSVFFSSFPNVGAVAIVDDLSIAMLAFSVASGFSYDVTGLSGKECGDWLANDALPTYLKQNGFQSKDEWWGNAKVESYPLTGKVVFGKMAVQLLSDFFSWITGKYNVSSGGDAVPVYTSDVTSYLLADGTPFVVFNGPSYSSLLRQEVPPCTVINPGINLYFMSGAKFVWEDDYLWFYDCMGNAFRPFHCKEYSNVSYYRFVFIYEKSLDTVTVCSQSILTDGVIRDPSYDWQDMRNIPLSRLGEPAQGGSLSISASETLTVPDASTMTEDDVYTIAANVTAETQEEYYQKVLDAIAANSFSATTVTDVPDVPVEGDTTILGVVSNIWEGVKSIPQTFIDVGATIVSGVGTAVQGIQDAVLDIPVAIGQAVTGIKQAIVDFFTPSESLTVDGLSSVFPFCVPSDLVALVQALNHRSEAPVFVIPLNFSFVNYEDELVIDLTDWEPAAAAVRWGVTILFIGGLILLTRNLIKG